MKKNTLLVLGYFGYNNNQIDGQTIKTRNIYKLVESKIGEGFEVSYADTQIISSQKLYLFKLLCLVWKSTQILYLPGKNNLKYIFPLIYVICKLKSISIVYIVVGGWLYEFLYKQKAYIGIMSNFKAILVESVTLKNKLISTYNFNNVDVIPNFRIHSFTPNHVIENDFKIVFMARIMKLKGYQMLIDFALYVEKNRINYPQNIQIDFYGPLNKEDENDFLAAVSKYDFVNYKGVIQPSDVFSILQAYDILVLPTKYPGEGFPGTIIDAYIAGIPVIVSDWKYLPEFVDNGETGFVFDLNEPDELYKYINMLYNDSEMLSRLKNNVLKKRDEYSSDSAWSILKKALDK